MGSCTKLVEIFGVVYFKWHSNDDRKLVLQLSVWLPLVVHWGEASHPTHHPPTCTGRTVLTHDLVILIIVVGNWASQSLEKNRILLSLFGNYSVYMWF